MGVAQADYQAAEAAINKKRDDFFHRSLLLSFADQSEYPLWSSTNWERAANLSLQSLEQSSNSYPYIKFGWPSNMSLRTKSQPTLLALFCISAFPVKEKKKQAKTQ